MTIAQSARPNGRPRWALFRRASTSDAIARRPFAARTKDDDDSAPNKMRRYARKCDRVFRDGFSQRRPSRERSRIMAAYRHFAIRQGTLIRRLKDEAASALTTASISSKAYLSVRESQPFFLGLWERTVPSGCNLKIGIVSPEFRRPSESGPNEQGARRVRSYSCRARGLPDRAAAPEARYPFLPQ